MPVSSDTLRLLMAAGLDGDDLLRVVASIDADNQPGKRSTGATRQARYRANLRAKSVTGDVTSDVTESVTGDAPLTRVEDKPLTTEITKAGSKKTRSADADAFKAELSDLDPEHLTALIEHRRRKRGAITAKAARMFRSDAERCGLTLADAVDTCIRRNWIALEPEWLAKPNARAGPERPPPLADVFKLVKERTADGQGQQASSSVRALVSHLPVVRTG